MVSILRREWSVIRWSALDNMVKYRAGASPRASDSKSLHDAKSFDALGHSTYAGE